MIFISSASWAGRRNYFGLYAACKNSIEAFTKSLDLEYSEKIDFCCYRTGSVKTKMNRSGMPGLNTIP